MVDVDQFSYVATSTTYSLFKVRHAASRVLKVTAVHTKAYPYFQEPFSEVYLVHYSSKPTNIWQTYIWHLHPKVNFLSKGFISLFP